LITNVTFLEKRNKDMEDRIEINGVWYRRETEDVELNVKYEIDGDFAEYRGLVWETDEFCFEASRLYKDGGEELHKDFDIKFTDKRFSPWAEDHWDSMSWFEAMHLGNRDSVEGLKKEIGETGVAQTRAFLNFLARKGWL
jgi:hypothetical protein